MANSQSTVEVNPTPPATQSIEYCEIKGFPGYRVGSDGSVWSCKNARWGFRSSWKKMKPTPIGRGMEHGRCHYRVSLRVAGKKHDMLVHRLVLEAFIGPCPAGMEGCHFPDRDPSNNNLSNLRWGTRSENINDSKLHNTFPLGESRHGAKRTEAEIRKIRMMSSGGARCCDIANAMRLHPAFVSEVLSGKRWKHVDRSRYLANETIQRERG